ncbi:class I SAM-dependent methyltransferase [Marivibrio halodurans]|uniref:Class I SAM-dependent methyltransferase n=1 Tax=Marivibrio halodurans TaxID=2039722 RepID=A0A8J7V2J2_9PROT|nr:class I SAM-dependent methyltransferase [Marivibrio halodurans]MBP5855829.1 class I SAM-dependent methyltransferase [Marivibrio halodurans]
MNLLGSGGFKDHFSASAAAYRRSRPGYPDGLFAWLAGLPAAGERNATAWDCGCGNGQASIGLARHVGHVIATDPSAGQVARAAAHPRIRYLAAPAERTPIAADSIDLVVAAQAAHWFDIDAFYREVRRVARPGAVVALITYGPLRASGTLDTVLSDIYHGPVNAHWPPERAHVEAGYRTLPFPFAEIAPPVFAMRARWPMERLVDYISTWSAVKVYREATGTDPIPEARARIADAWGDPMRRREIRWPLSLRVGHVHGDGMV